MPAVRTQKIPVISYNSVKMTYGRPELVERFLFRSHVSEAAAGTYFSDIAGEPIFCFQVMCVLMLVFSTCEMRADG